MPCPCLELRNGRCGGRPLFTARVLGSARESRLFTPEFFAQGRVRRRDILPGMQEAGWRSCWTMLLMAPFQVSSTGSSACCFTPHRHACRRRSSRTMLLAEPLPVCASGLLGIRQVRQAQHCLHLESTSDACDCLLSRSAPHPPASLPSSTASWRWCSSTLVRPAAGGTDSLSVLKTVHRWRQQDRPQQAGALAHMRRCTPSHQPRHRESNRHREPLLFSFLCPCAMLPQTAPTWRRR